MGFNDIVQALYSCLPETPSSSVGSLSAAVSDDRISALPDSLLGNILSRLPVNDAARTAVLSPRWRGLWRSTPLVLEDRHLVIQPAGRRDGFDPSAHAAAVSRVLTSHPGPFRWVHISANTMADQQETLLQWLRLFVAKGVETLVLVNRPWPIDLALPASILRCASLRRLYLGVWKFPDTSRPHVPPRGPGVFPNLQELGICHTIIQDHDIDYLLACSPELKLLALIFSDGFTSRLFISSNSLRCVVLWLSTLEEVDIVAAPRLQRLILECTGTKHIIKVKVGYAPELTVLGYLDTATHVLEIGNTIISARVTNVTPNEMVPSVKVLALKVDFKVTEEVKTLLCFLRCFPHVETLHIMSNKNEVKQQDQRDAGDDGCEQFSPMFWQDVGSIECVESQVKKVVLGQLTAGPNELGFIKFLLGTAQVLKRVVLVLAVTMSPTSADEAMSKLDSQLPSIECASENVQFTVLSCPRAAWSYRRASDVLLSDPFPG